MRFASLIFYFPSLKFTNIWDNLEKKEGTYNLIELINKSEINIYFIAPASKAKKVVAKKDQKQKVIKKEIKPKVTKK